MAASQHLHHHAQQILAAAAKGGTGSAIGHAGEGSIAALHVSANGTPGRSMPRPLAPLENAASLPTAAANKNVFNPNAVKPWDDGITAPGTVAGVATAGLIARNFGGAIGMGMKGLAWVQGKLLFKEASERMTARADRVSGKVMGAFSIPTIAESREQAAVSNMASRGFKRIGLKGIGEGVAQAEDFAAKGAVRFVEGASSGLGAAFKHVGERGFIPSASVAIWQNGRAAKATTGVVEHIANARVSLEGVLQAGLAAKVPAETITAMRKELDALHGLSKLSPEAATAALASEEFKVHLGAIKKGVEAMAAHDNSWWRFVGRSHLGNVLRHTEKAGANLGAAEKYLASAKNWSTHFAEAFEQMPNAFKKLPAGELAVGTAVVAGAAAALDHAWRHAHHDQAALAQLKKDMGPEAGKVIDAAKHDINGHELREAAIGGLIGAGSGAMWAEGVGMMGQMIGFKLMDGLKLLEGERDALVTLYGPMAKAFQAKQVIPAAAYAKLICAASPEIAKKAGPENRLVTELATQYQGTQTAPAVVLQEIASGKLDLHAKQIAEAQDAAAKAVATKAAATKAAVPTPATKVAPDSLHAGMMTGGQPQISGAALG